MPELTEVEVVRRSPKKLNIDPNISNIYTLHSCQIRNLQKEKLKK